MQDRMVYKDDCAEVYKVSLNLCRSIDYRRTEWLEIYQAMDWDLKVK